MYKEGEIYFKREKREKAFTFRFDLRFRLFSLTHTVQSSLLYRPMDFVLAGSTNDTSHTRKTLTENDKK